jgi:hypothetical protein
LALVYPYSVAFKKMMRAQEKREMGRCSAYRHFAKEILRVPMSNVFAGTSLATTTDAPMTEPAPILTPGMFVLRAPSQAPFPTSIGAEPMQRPRCSGFVASRVLVKNITSCPTATWSPMVT